MAQIETGGGNGKGKNHQKKMTIRVDFTPMVDMNMLLITFFMLCTTMIKTQTLNIALPSNDKVDNVENMSQASADDAVTIILDAKRAPGSMDVDMSTGAIVPEIYYYFGKPDEENGQPVLDANGNVVIEKIKATTFKTGDSKDDIREIIRKRNKEVLEKIEPIRKEFHEGKKTQAEFDSLAKIIRRDENLKKPVIVIKATPEASYGSLVSLLDEMQINQIAKYQIDNMTRMDSVLLIDYQNKHHK